MERLLAHPVACQQQRTLTDVPDSEGEHAVEMVHAVLAPRLVCVHEDLGIGPRAKAVPQTLQMGAERLVTGLRVDDAEASDAQREEGVNVETLTVGAAMAQRLGHSPRRVTATVVEPVLKKPCEPADGWILSAAYATATPAPKRRTPDHSPPRSRSSRRGGGRATEAAPDRPRQNSRSEGSGRRRRTPRRFEAPPRAGPDRRRARAPARRPRRSACRPSRCSDREREGW